MQAYFERARRMMAEKQAEENKLKEMLAEFNAAKEAGNTKLCVELKKRIEHMATGNCKPEPQFKQYTRKEMDELQSIRNKEV